MAISTESPIKRHLTNVAEWQKMGEAGVFPFDCKLELIQGEIIEMAPVGSHHASYLKRLIHVFSGLIKNSAIIAAQDPLRLNNFSEPQPDLMLLRPRSDFYYQAHPTADDVLLLVEISDSSLEYDQNLKLHLYAGHAIQEYWLLNIRESCLEVYREPKKDFYAEKLILGSGDIIKLSQFKDLSLDLSEIFN